MKNIVRELNNEKVDIIRWSEDPKEFVREALKPAELRSITVDEDNKVVHVTVDEIDLSKAIGRKGQNARLSSRLMGWDVQVRRDESKEEQFKEKIGGAAHTLGELLGISDELAGKLTLAGGIAHDFNNLLTAISGHCDLLLLRHRADDLDHADLIQIHQNANRAAALVGQLLAYSRKQTLKPEKLELEDVLSDLTHLLNRLVGEKISLRLSHGIEDEQQIPMPAGLLIIPFKIFFQ